MIKSGLQKDIWYLRRDCHVHPISTMVFSTPSKWDLYCMCKLLSAWRPEKIAPKLLLAKGMEITLFAFQGFGNLRECSEIYKDITYWLQQLLICPVPMPKYITEWPILDQHSWQYPDAEIKSQHCCIFCSQREGRQIFLNSEHHHWSKSRSATSLQFRCPSSFWHSLCSPGYYCVPRAICKPHNDKQ